MIISWQLQFTKHLFNLSIQIPLHLTAKLMVSKMSTILPSFFPFIFQTSNTEGDRPMRFNERNKSQYILIYTHLQ